MARLLSQTLLRHSRRALKPPPPSITLITLRNRSNRSGKLIEIDLESTLSSASSSSSSSSSSSASSSSASDEEGEVLGLRGLEEAIHSIIVQKSTPDWIPFVPGSSFWVPPRRRPVNVVDLVGKLARPLTFEEEENLSFATVRGWPSFEFLARPDGESPHTSNVESANELSKEEVVEIRVFTTSEDRGSDDDE
ncbi:uncharacterized protein LOC115744602 [Rhodamnia argentea]|uniref:Uncharacterized protein LOC115744602 n=1 Tax=Rhodamnia argentea TaxID=178133 RepID=A0A8B8PMW4_9MYRT|nr:uncharacterized protein LOC115744602 [Rhodamnia argentea]